MVLPPITWSKETPTEDWKCSFKHERLAAFCWELKETAKTARCANREALSGRSLEPARHRVQIAFSANTAGFVGLIKIPVCAYCLGNCTLKLQLYTFIYDLLTSVVSTLKNIRLYSELCWSDCKGMHSFTLSVFIECLLLLLVLELQLHGQRVSVLVEVIF